MKRTSTAIQYCFLAITLGALLSVVPSNAQTPAPAPDRDTDLNRQQLAAFDQFLDSHQELAQELRKDPSLVNNQEFLASHSDLQHYLEQHPEVREGLTQNPNAVLNQEQRFDRREDRQVATHLHRPGRLRSLLPGHQSACRTYSQECGVPHGSTCRVRSPASAKSSS